MSRARESGSSGEIIDQQLCVLQVLGIESLSKPGAERGEEVARGGAFALIPPEAGEAGGGAQLEGLRLLRARDVEGAVEEGLRFRLRIAEFRLRIGGGGIRIPQSAFRNENLPPEPMQLGVEEVLVRIGRYGKRRLERAKPLAESAGDRLRLRE